MDGQEWNWGDSLECVYHSPGEKWWWLGVGWCQERWRDVDEFEVYFVGLRGQSDVEVQGKRQWRVVSRFFQLGGWQYNLFRGGNQDMKRYWNKSRVLDTLIMKCKVKGESGAGDVLWEVGEHVDGILGLRMDSESRESLDGGEAFSMWRWGAGEITEVEAESHV